MKNARRNVGVQCVNMYMMVRITLKMLGFSLASTEIFEAADFFGAIGVMSQQENFGFRIFN